MDVSRHHRRERRQGGRRHGRTRRQHPVLLPGSRGERHAQSVAAAVDHRRAPHPVSLPVAELRRQAFPGHPRPPGRKVRPAAIACRRQPCGQRDPLHLSTPRRKLRLDQDQIRHEIGKEALPLRGVGRDHQDNGRPADRRGCRSSSIWRRSPASSPRTRQHPC